MLIVLEGIDGVGKSSVAQDLARRLREAGHRVTETREPWDSEAGLRLKELLAAAERTSSAEEELALFHEDRAAHVAAVVRPARARGEWVVQDRSFYSTAAYQGARGLDVGAILTRSEQIAPVPDLVVLLLLTPEEALERIARGRSSFSSFERLDAIRAVDRVYRQLLEDRPEMVGVGAGPPLPEVCEAVASVVARRCGGLAGASGTSCPPGGKETEKN